MTAALKTTTVSKWLKKPQVDRQTDYFLASKTTYLYQLLIDVNLYLPTYLPTYLLSQTFVAHFLPFLLTACPSGGSWEDAGDFCYL